MEMNKYTLRRCFCQIISDMSDAVGLIFQSNLIGSISWLIQHSLIELLYSQNFYSQKANDLQIEIMDGVDHSIKLKLNLVALMYECFNDKLCSVREQRVQDCNSEALQHTNEFHHLIQLAMSYTL